MRKVSFSSSAFPSPKTFLELDYFFSNLIKASELMDMSQNFGFS
jgi:hypothetical protein